MNSSRIVAVMRDQSPPPLINLFPASSMLGSATYAYAYTTYYKNGSMEVPCLEG